MNRHLVSQICSLFSKKKDFKNTMNAMGRATKNQALETNCRLDSNLHLIQNGMKTMGNKDQSKIYDILGPKRQFRNILYQFPPTQLNKLVLQHTQKRKASLGSLIEYLVIKALLNSQNQRQLTIGQKCFTADSHQYFQHFLGKKKNPDQNLSKLIQKSKKQGCFGIPVTASQYKKRLSNPKYQCKISPNSPVFDLLFIQQENGSIRIQSSDFTITESSSKVTEKIKKAQQFFLKIFSKKCQVKEWNHQIFCRPSFLHLRTPKIYSVKGTKVEISLQDITKPTF